MLIEGTGRENLKVPSKVTVSRDVHAQFDHLYKSSTDLLSSAESRVFVTFDLWKDRSGRRVPFVEESKTLFDGST